MSHFFHNVNQCKNIFRKELSFIFDAGRVDDILKTSLKNSAKVFFITAQECS